MAERTLAAAFLKSLRMSGLMDEAVVAQHLTELRNAGVNEQNAFQLSDAFVERGWVTRWQADMLLDGKHRGFQLGKYRLLSQLGRGGMGTVYLAEHTLMKRRCAIKVLPPQKTTDVAKLARFEREAHAIAALSHQNIVRAYDFDREQDKDTIVHFLVMEFVDGGSLEDRVGKSGPLSPNQAADYIRQAADGLAHAHHAGMLHRDIKPSNLLVDASGCLKILDLGLARFFGEGSPVDEPRPGIQYTGTVDYLAPEQAIDCDKSDARADIYSLGCTFYFLLAGRPPFPEGTIPQKLIDHQSRVPVPIEKLRSDVPASLIGILQKSMAKKPDERYSSAAELSKALSRWLHDNETKGLTTKKRAHAPEKQKPSAVSPAKVPGAKAPAVNPFSELPLEEYRARRPSKGSSSGDGPIWAQLLRWPPPRELIPAVATTAGVVLLLLGGLIYWIFRAPPRSASARDVAVASPPATSRKSVADGANTTEVERGREPAPSGPTGDIAVGPNGDFKTIGEALEHVRRQFSPLSRARGRTISVEGGRTYAERITIDNSDLSFPNGIRLVSKGAARAVLAPTGADPVIKLTGSPKAVEHFVIEGFDLRAENKPVAIELSGFVVGTRLVDLKISGFTQCGLLGKGTVGIDVARGRFVVDRCTFLGQGDSAGIRFTVGDNIPGHLTVQSCRFAGPMKSGVVFRDQALDIAIRDSGFYRIDAAIMFEGVGPEWREIAIEDNTFHLGERGIHFRGVPSSRSSGLAFRRNLFAGLSSDDGSFEGKYDERAFFALIGNNGISNNWTSRPAAAPTASNGTTPIDLVQSSGRRGVECDFASADPQQPQFLFPAEGAAHAGIGVRPKK